MSESLERSSTFLIGVSRRPLVMEAVRLAVYDEVMIRAKNHHIPATKRVDTALHSI